MTKKFPNLQKLRELQDLSMLKPISPLSYYPNNYNLLSNFCFSSVKSITGTFSPVFEWPFKSRIIVNSPVRNPWVTMVTPELLLPDKPTQWYNYQIGISSSKCNNTFCDSEAVVASNKASKTRKLSRHYLILLSRLLPEKKKQKAVSQGK